MCGFHAESVNRDCGATEEMEEVRWFTVEDLDAAVSLDNVRLPPPVSIAFRLIADWYRQQCGGDLDERIRHAGSWVSRKGIK